MRLTVTTCNTLMKLPHTLCSPTEYVLIYQKRSGGEPQRAWLHLAPTPGERGGRQDVVVGTDPPNKASEHGQDGREYGTKVREETKTQSLPQMSDLRSRWGQETIKAG